MPKIKLLKLAYHLSKGRTKKKKIAICGGGVMREEDYIRCMEIIKECKQEK